MVYESWVSPQRPARNEMRGDMTAYEEWTWAYMLGIFAPRVAWLSLAYFTLPAMDTLGSSHLKEKVDGYQDSPCYCSMKINIPEGSGLFEASKQAKTSTQMNTRYTHTHTQGSKLTSIGSTDASNLKKFRSTT